MMEFNVIDFNNKELWEKIVKDKEIYYFWQYVDAFYKNGDGVPFLAYAKNDNNYVFNVYFKRDISNDKNLEGKIEKNLFFDISSPYGYGGIDVVGEEDPELINYYFSEFKKYCKKNNIISEFVRLNPLSDNYKFYSNLNYELIQLSKTVYINLEDEEKIWTNMESNCRNKIRKAQKYNLAIKTGFDEQMFQEFIYIYKETMARDSATDYYYFNKDFFDSIYENLKNNAIIYTVYFEDKPINSILVIYNGKNCHYHLSGTLTEYMKLAANNLSLYEIAKDFCQKGYKKFHLGGGYGGDASPLLKFKKSFNKDGELDFYIAKMIFNQELYDKLVSIRENDENFDKNSNYFPLYRSLK